MSRVHKFAHDCIRVVVKGKMRVQCCCGEQSPLFSDTGDVAREDQAREWEENHTGLIERVPKEVW